MERLSQIRQRSLGLSSGDDALPDDYSPAEIRRDEAIQTEAQSLQGVVSSASMAQQTALIIPTQMTPDIEVWLRRTGCMA